MEKIGIIDLGSNSARLVIVELFGDGVFAEHGFEWGGDWKHAKDYQHFEIPDEWIEKSSCRKM